MLMYWRWAATIEAFSLTWRIVRGAGSRPVRARQRQKHPHSKRAVVSIGRALRAFFIKVQEALHVSEAIKLF